MKKAIILTTLMTISGAGQTATLVAGHTYDINILADGISCFAYGSCESYASDGYNPYFIDNNNDALASAGSSDPDFGSSISGDGLAGKINISTSDDGAGGVNFTVNSFNMDTYTETPMGFFATMAKDPSTMSGNVDAGGNITLDLIGRTGMWQYFNYAFDEVVFPGVLTSNTHSNAFGTFSGTKLALDGSAVILTAGGIGEGAGIPYWGWGILGDGAPYMEVFSLQFVGGDIIPSAVPVPAALWLFGSGLVGLIALARRKIRI